MKKSITEISNEDLLKSIEENTSNEVVYNWPNDIMEFISFYNLKAGEERITTKLLFKLYSRWSKNPVPRSTLSQTFTDIFPSVSSNGSLTILLNKDALNISNEVYKYLKKGNKTKQKNWTKHFITFLDHYSIKKGGLFIKNSVLYNLYDKWTYKNSNKNSLGYYQFSKFCKLFFEQKRTYGYHWSGVNDSIKNHLTEDLINLMYKKATKREKKEIKTK